MTPSLTDLRELSGMDERELIQMGLVRAEGMLVEGLDDVANSINERRREDWPDRDELRAHLQSLPEEQQRQQVEQTLAMLESDVARVFNSYHEVGLVDDGMAHFEAAIKDLVVSTHSPVVQESILLMVRPPFRDYLSDRMEAFGVLLWGWYAVIQGVETAHTDPYLNDYLAPYWQMDPAELRSMVAGEESVHKQQQ